MHPPTHFATHPDLLGTWAMLAVFGAYHGLNPAMGWLFALALGLQQKSERAVWRSLIPISLGHAASIAIVAAAVLAAGHLVSIAVLRYATAGLLLGFGVYKLLTYYRHPRWVGMRVTTRDLFIWSFIMAMAHGAGLMVAPMLLEVTGAGIHAGAAGNAGGGIALAVALHTAAMLAVMAVVAFVLYRWFGLAILRKSWINFDLIWAVALLGDDVVVAEAGTWVIKPRRQWHTFWNPGDTPCEIIEIISPAGFENYFREVADAWGDVERFRQINDKYGLDMDFDSVPGLCERFGLTFPSLETQEQ